MDSVQGEVAVAISDPGSCFDGGGCGRGLPLVFEGVVVGFKWLPSAFLVLSGLARPSLAWPAVGYIWQFRSI